MSKTKGKLKQVSNKYDFIEMEKRLVDWWYKNGIVDKYIHKNDGAKENFSFIDGPITANNPMGLHHAWGRTYKDLVQRYKNMKGFEQRFQMGFDCQGLWVEVGVEKELKFNSKKDIYDYGIGNFTNTCKNRVYKFADVQTFQSKRLGMFADWENSYYTMSEENNLYIWSFLKKVHDEGKLYKSHSVVTWCPRCETGLSQHEQADSYKTITDTSLYVKFKLKDEDAYVLAWTTTPWTLSANVLLAVNPKLEYVKASDGKDVYYLAKKPAEKLGLEILEEVDPKSLVGKEYEPLYDDIEAQQGVKHWIVDWDLVEEDSGTGVVHMAPGCGAEDFERGTEVGADVLSPLDETGHFMKGYGELTGKYAHDVVDQVIDYLKAKDALFKVEEFEHQYPFCWRCKTKCVFRAEDTWLINLQDIKPKLKAEAAKVNWMPNYAGKRMENWLDSMGDWMISRKRFYGLSLPFYECSECGELTVVGSKEELRDLAVEPEKVDKLESLHRPWIDEIKIKCPKCGAEVSRIPDVGDCWLDAGVVPFSTLKYKEDRKYWEKWYPSDFSTEMIEQVRLWFYSMLVFGVILDGTAPYTNVLTFGELRDENNEKMSKSKPNYIPFDQAADKGGSDLIRWNFAVSPITKNVRFGWNILDDVKKRFYFPLWNSYVYFVTYANIHNWEPTEFKYEDLTDVLDKWIVNRLKEVSEFVSEHMDKFDISPSARKIEEFVTDLSTWYIRRSRSRFVKGDVTALNTLYYVLVQLTKLLAPFVPFITEEMYQNLVVNLGVDWGRDSVHLEDYPEFSFDLNQDLLDDMESTRKLASLGLKIRDDKSLRVRQPLREAVVNVNNQDLLEILKSEMNVKTISYKKKPVLKDGWVTEEAGHYFVSLNIELDEELKKEGWLNDLKRGIQNARKASGAKVGDKVKLEFYTEDEEIEDFISKNKSKLEESLNVELHKAVGQPDVKPVKVNDVRVYITKV